MDYDEFVSSKRHRIIDEGLDIVWAPSMAFDFQVEVCRRALISGRKAIFADTGLGKTLIQITIAENIVRQTNKNVLILTPLAVAHQFVQEAEKIGSGQVQYSKDGSFSSKIVVTNYERIGNFNPNDFEAVVLDESSILKNFDGQVKNNLLVFIRKVKYRFLSSATPSPNDYTELGNSSEALGFMGYMDMLGAFFKNNQNSTDSRSRNVGEKYYLKPHAEADFFAWVNQWAIMIRKPSDLGFSDEKYQLPPLHELSHFIGEKSDPNIRVSFSDLRKEQKDTEVMRCLRAYELAHGKTSVYWCNTNAENDLIKHLDPDAVCITGGMNIDKKEETLIAFQRGDIKRLVTKAKMTSMGLNWQHCNHSVFFPTYSYEQYYQAVRRFWRFGQTSEVFIDSVLSPSQTRMIEAIKQKKEKAQQLYERLTNSVNNSYDGPVQKTNDNIILPRFL